MILSPCIQTIKTKQNLAITVLLLLLTNVLMAGNFVVAFAPTEIYYKNLPSDSWQKVTCGTVLSETSTIQLPSFSYLLLLHDEGGMYSEDTVGIIELKGLKTLITAKKYPFSYQILTKSLNSLDFKNRNALFYFCEEQTSSRCCGSYFVFGGEQKSYVRKNNSKLHWVNTDRLKHTSFKVKITNLYEEELLSKPLKLHEPVTITSKLIENLTEDDFIKVHLLSGKTEVNTVLRIMPEEKAKLLNAELEILKKEYSSDNDLAYLVCRYLIQRNHQVLLECGETYYSIFNKIQSKYGSYNTDYFEFFYQSKVSIIGTVASFDGKKLQLQSDPKLLSIPAGTTLLISSQVSGLSYSIGTGIYEGQGKKGFEISWNSTHSFILKNNTTIPTLQAGELIEISYME
jgi:hypothetical protein